MSTANLWEPFAQDLKFAARTLRRSPGFTAVAVLSLALGIGANTAIFSFLNALLLRPLPYPDPDRIAILREQPLKKEGTVGVHPFNFLQWRQQARSFESLTLVQAIPVNTMAPEGAEQLSALWITSDFFRVFGAAPFLGRSFTPEETTRGDHRVVILSHGLWQQRFASDAAAIGKDILLNGQARRIIGVTPLGFRVPSTTTDLYLPMPIDPSKPDSIGSRSFVCYGRLRPDVSLASAQSEMSVLAAQLARQYPLDKGYGVAVFGVHDYLVRESRPALFLLMAVVAMVLLIACVNLAGLLLARGIERRGELAIRAALGAGRLRLVQQFTVESLLLSGLGGAIGLALGQWATRLLVVLCKGAFTFEGIDQIHLDWKVIGFAIALSAITALLFGSLPTWHACRMNVQVALKEGGRRSTGDRRHNRLRNALVVGEVALAVILLVSAGLLLRTFSSLLQVRLGFQPQHVLTMRLFLPYRERSKRANLIEQILQRVEGLPDVRAVGTIQFLPMSGLNSGTGFRLEGQPDMEPSQSLSTEVSLISRGYFSAMRIPIVEGRVFGPQDRIGTPRVVIVNQSFVRKYFPDGRALGRKIVVSWSDEVPAEIVGVVGDVRHNGLTTEPQPAVFLLHSQTPGYITHLVVSTTGTPATVVAATRRAVQEVDSTQAITGIKTMQQYVDESLARPRIYAALLATFAGLALILAGIGLYGLVAYATAQRTHEIGIRMALGAQPAGVLAMVLSQGAVLAGAGLILGVGAALALGRLLSGLLLSGLLFGVTSTDPVTYVAVAIVLAAVALLAVYLPARRAAKVDPVVALRYE